MNKQIAYILVWCSYITYPFTLKELRINENISFKQQFKIMLNKFHKTK